MDWDGNEVEDIDLSDYSGYCPNGGYICYSSIAEMEKEIAEYEDESCGCNVSTFIETVREIRNN
jgi:hypothetical protein